jgi:hypothetical protein
VHGGFFQVLRIFVVSECMKAWGNNEDFLKHYQTSLQNDDTGIPHRLMSVKNERFVLCTPLIFLRAHTHYHSFVCHRFCLLELAVFQFSRFPPTSAFCGRPIGRKVWWRTITEWHLPKIIKSQQSSTVYTTKAFMNQQVLGKLDRSEYNTNSYCDQSDKALLIHEWFVKKFDRQ